MVLALPTLLRGESLPELALGLVLRHLTLNGFVASAHGPILIADHPLSQQIVALGSFDGQELGGQVRTVSSSPMG